MNPYPSYLTNNYQQYQQPMYQPMQNPYMDRMQQMQSMQPQMNQMQIPQMQQAQQAYQNLNGRIVDDFNVITANDVPMDGNGAIFVKKDGTEIQVRNWTAQGTIHTNVFKPVLIEQTKDLQNSGQMNAEWLSKAVTGVFQPYFDKLNDRLDKLEQSIAPID